MENPAEILRRRRGVGTLFRTRQNGSLKMWNKIKSGFAYGVGGAIGWRLGNWLAGLLAKLFFWIVALGGLGLFAGAGDALKAIIE